MMKESLYEDLNGFRPLDGESFSKLCNAMSKYNATIRFRPLDGESFSKRFKSE